MNENFDIENSLKGLKKETGFSTPDGYFDNLAHKIQARCIEETRVPEKTSLIQILKPQLAFISMITIFGLLTFSVYKLVIPNYSIKENISSIELNIEDFDYIDIEEEIIVDALISESDTSQLKEQEQEEEISDELLHYFIENHADFTTLLEYY